MDTSSDRSPHAEHSGAGEAGPRHLINMNMTMASTADQITTSNMQQKRRDALDERIDELEQRLAALTAYESPSRSSTASFETAREQISPAAPSKKALGKRKEQNYSPNKPGPVILPQQGSRRQSPTTIQTSSRPTTSTQRPSTRRNSTAPTSQIPSTSSSSREARAPTSTRPSTSSSGHGALGSSSSSRRSSFKLNQPAAGTTQPAQQRRRHRRATNTTWPSITVHPDGRQALQSLRAFSDLRSEILTDMRAEQKQHLTSSSLPTLLFHQHPTTTTTTPPTETQTQTETQNPNEYSNHVPASNIDWTTPATRRAEYAKIDRSRTGVRGLLRRVTPRFLRRRMWRVGFHDDRDEDGKGSDAGTVRRFRMDLDVDVEDGRGEDGGGGSHKGSGDDKEGGKECGDGMGDRGNRKGRWWKIGKMVKAKMGKGKGKGERTVEGGH